VQYRPGMRPRWLRGNLHTHTTNSDGDSDPATVTSWYRDAEYDFLALTDHDRLTDTSALAEAAGRMVLVPAEEVSSGPAHVNGFGLRTEIAPSRRGSARESWQADIDAIRAAGGLPQVNHPNFVWQARPDDLAALTGVPLVEIWNGSPDCNDRGRPGHPSSEELWDIALTAGSRLWGTATDDAHHFRRWGRAWANPGRGWVHVRSARLAEDAILAALEAGDFYASTGVRLLDIVREADALRVLVAARGDLHYTTTFIGAEGRILAVEHGPEAVYRFGGREPYVRARVDDSDGLSAWVQPVFPGG